MDTLRYLKDVSYYNDLYDLHTIEECLDYYWSIRDGFEKEKNKFKRFTQKQLDKEAHKIASYTVNVIKGARYRHKAERIKEWMDRDAKTQEKHDTSTPPDGIYCKECYSETKVISKDLLNSHEENSKVLFMFECLKCKKRQAFFEDGTEWRHEPERCPQCNNPLESKTEDKNDVLTTTYSCPKCSYKKKDVYDFKKSRVEREKKEASDRKLLAEYRDEFCLNDTNGPGYVVSLDQIINFAKEMEEKEKKEKDPIFQKAAKLKKLKVVEVERLLDKTLTKEGFLKLELSQPKFERYLEVNFTVQDSNTSRSEYDSRNTLKKLVNKALIDTSWRLMSEGITYKLGYLYGRLKGYEHEEDLVELVRNNNKDKTVMRDEKI